MTERLSLWALLARWRFILALWGFIPNRLLPSRRATLLLAVAE
jgi:hypothetical protein